MESKTTTYSLLTTVVVLTIILGASFLAYNAGYLDPLIEQAG